MARERDGWPRLAVGGLTAGYGDRIVLAGVDLAVAAGEIVAVTGPNGAGKTTMLRAILGQVPLAGGAVRLDGRDLAGLPVEHRVRCGIGYVPEGRRLFAGLGVLDTLHLAAWAPAAERARRIDAVFALFPELASRADARAWQLSGGQQQMLAVGRALMGAPGLLLLDEPCLGLAPKAADALAAAVSRIAAGGVGVLLAEPSAARAGAWAGRVLELRGAGGHGVRRLQ